jgi:hypothetical protein
MRCQYACRSADHLTNRRGFLGGLASGAVGASLAATVQEYLAERPELPQR